MKYLILLVLLAFVSPVCTRDCAAAPPEAASQTEIEGDWLPVSIRNGDDSVLKENLAQLKFTFRGNRHTLTHTTLTVDETKAALRVDATKSPKEIDLELDDKSAAQRQPVTLGIYKLEGDVLTIAINRNSPKERPKAFPSKPKSGIEIITLKRIAAKQK